MPDTNNNGGTIANGDTSIIPKKTLDLAPADKNESASDDVLESTQPEKMEKSPALDDEHDENQQTPESAPACQDEATENQQALPFLLWPDSEQIVRTVQNKKTSENRIDDEQVEKESEFPEIGMQPEHHLQAPEIPQPIEKHEVDEIG